MTSTLTRAIVTADEDGTKRRFGRRGPDVPARAGLKARNRRETVTGYTFLLPWMMTHCENRWEGSESKVEESICVAAVPRGRMRGGTEDWGST